MEQYEGIVILAFPRSGTTLLRRILNAHPRIHSPPETNLLSAASRFLREEPFGDGLAIGVVPGLAYSGINDSEIKQRLREFVFSFERQLAQAAGKPRWAEKTAFDSFHASAIVDLCGTSCRYICLFRHGLDVIPSVADLINEMGMVMEDLRPYIDAYPRFDEAIARAWAHVNQNLLSLSADRPEFYHLKYEDLVADPEAEITRLLEFLGEPADAAAMVSAATQSAAGGGLGDWKTYSAAAVHRQSVGRRKELPAASLRITIPVLAPILEQLGYPPEVPPPEASPDEARRAHQLRQMAAHISAMRDNPPPDPAT